MSSIATYQMINHDSGLPLELPQELDASGRIDDSSEPCGRGRPDRVPVLFRRPVVRGPYP